MLNPHPLRSLWITFIMFGGKLWVSAGSQTQPGVAAAGRAGGGVTRFQSESLHGPETYVSARILWLISEIETASGAPRLDLFIAPVLSAWRASSLQPSVGDTCAEQGALLPNGANFRP